MGKFVKPFETLEASKKDSVMTQDTRTWLQKKNKKRRESVSGQNECNDVIFESTTALTAKSTFIPSRDVYSSRHNSLSEANLENSTLQPRKKEFKKNQTGEHKRRKRSMKRGEDRLKVAVRVRPFNEREKTRDAKLIIEMVGSTTIITDPEGKFPKKKFTFDFSYWSHDGFKERDDGYLESSASYYADQAKVFDDLGKGVLENSWKGFNCSLFAYGQTGSGKSYSMVGYNPNKGIIPITCEELFKGIEAKKASDDPEKEAEYQVSVSMLEIYNETVKDLLNVGSFKRGGLRVREHRQKGFYVENLQIAPVRDYADIEARIAEGTRNRTLAATNMNATSSRAHTIVAINFVQKAKNDVGKSMTKTSIINLVDLAGSERANSTGATGERLKEGSMINRSLLCLGNCIKALSDVQDGKHVSVPFRDSILTRLLKNALGGNSKTIMIAALSPADINYDETLSTLRFADRAKSIKTKAVINESPTDKLIREMKDEIKRLQDLLKHQGNGTIINNGISSDEVEEMRKNQEEELRRNQEEIDNMKQTWQQRLEEQRKENQNMLDSERAKQKARKTTPHLWNLNEDPTLTGMIIHLTPPGASTVGNTDLSSIVLKGLSIKKDHATIENNSNNLIYVNLDTNESKLLINGKQVNGRTELRHNDRVMFGSNQLYIFHHPQDAARQEKAGKYAEKVTFETAQEEIACNKGFDMNKTGKSKEDILLQEDLIQIMPLVNEANAMAEELDQKMFYEITLISPQARGMKDGRTEVSIKAKYLVNENEFLWSRNVFMDRYYAIQEMYQMFVEEDEDWSKKHEGTYPFRDPDDSDVIIGICYLYVQSFAYMMDMEDNLAIRSFQGSDAGMMNINAFPFTEAGKQLIDECVDEPEELIGKNLHFKIDVKKILGLSRRYQKVWCRYKFLLREDWNTSERVNASLNSVLNFTETFKVFPVTQQLLEEFENTPVVIEVWGKQKCESADPARDKLSTKELLELEGATSSISETVRYKNNRKPSRGSTDSQEKMQESNPPSPVVDAMKKAQVEIERSNKNLRKENETYKKKMEDMQRKFDLLTNLVNEALRKGEETVLVSRIDHILRSGENSTLQVIKSSILQTKASVSKLDISAKQLSVIQNDAITRSSPSAEANSISLFHSNGNGVCKQNGSKQKHNDSSSSSSSRSSNSPRSKKAARSGICAIL